MKHIYLGILCLFNYQLTQSQVTIYSDDFENGLGNWTVTGQWGLATSQAYNGTYSFADSPSGNYLNAQTTYATLDSVFDLSTSLDANIYFKAKYDIENGFDYCYIDLSSNNGSTWTTAYTINGEGNLGNWSEFNINVGGFVGNSQVKMRYRLYTDAGYQSDGIFVDSLRITKDSVDNAPPLILHDPDIHYEGQVDTNYRTFTITDISGVASAVLYYSVDGGAYTQTNPIDTSGDDYTYAIPPEDAGAYVDYYVEAIDSSAQTNSGLSDFYHYVSGNYIKYESGEVNFITSYTSTGAFTGTAMRMTLDGLTTITTAFIGNYTDVNNPNDSMLFHVWTDSNGAPGSNMITPIMVFPAANLLQPHLITRIDLRPYESQLDSLIGDVHIGFTVPSGTVWLAQTTPGTSSRVQNFNGSTWSSETDDYHFRIVTDTMILPPVAEFGIDATGDPVIVFSDSSENNPLSWHWDFGDGDTSIVQNPTHTYDIGAYNVCLEVSNAAGSDEICKGMIVFNGPPSAFFTYSTSNDPEIAFNDLSTQGPTSWSWDFGDGDTSTTQSPTHNYLDTGDFTVCLIAANAFGSDTFCQTLHIYNRRPEAFFVYTVFLDTAVTFTDLSGFSPTAWSWDFDNNGDTSDVQNPGYLFPGTGGTFNVCLTASNAYGSSTPYCDDVEIKDLVGIDHISANGVVISPNPAKDYASITLPKRITNASYQVFSSDGKLVMRKSNLTSNAFNIDVSSLQAGIYFIEISENETSFVKMPLMVID
ncbi:PKD domain-containing protein [Salibacteraceae bacterium]|nr:PKD domain-containing protein [Salibacteraceae bacterium]